MKRISYVLLLWLFIQTASAQNLLNGPAIHRQHQIKSLTVRNCLSEANCYTDYYEFNACGEVSRMQPAMVAFYMRYEYDDQCRLIRRLDISSYREEPNDSVWAQAVYEYPKDDTTHMLIKHYDKTELVLTDTVPITQPWETMENLIRNEQGQIVQHSYGTLYYPCGIEIEGKHTSTYHYDDEGLISHVVVRNTEGKVVVDLEYVYTR